MNPNIVLFDDLKVIDHYSDLFSDKNVIVAGDFSEVELKEFNQKKRKFKTKFFSCLLFKTKDNKKLQKFKKMADFTAVLGSSTELNQWCVNQKIDFLLQPFSPSKNFFDLQTANTLKESGAITCFLFSEFLNARGFAFSQLLKNASLCAKLCEKAGAGMLFCSGANNEFELRASRDLGNFGLLLGVKKIAKQKEVKIGGVVF